MKTMLKVTLVVALFFFATSTFAAGNLNLNISPVSGYQAVVTISNLNEGPLSITVKDSKGRMVYYNENLDQKANFEKTYDFSYLKDGKYKLTAVCNNITTERKFKISNKKIQVGNEKTTLEPFFSYDDGILRCTYLNFSNENLKLNLFQEDQLLFSKNIGRNFNLTEAMNLSKLKEGNFEAVLLAGEKEYSYKINIQ